MWTSFLLVEFKYFKWAYSNYSVPFVSGLSGSMYVCPSLISIWTSSLPGRSRASSIRSFLFVIPISRMLFSCSTPSIYTYTRGRVHLRGLGGGLLTASPP